MIRVRIKSINVIIDPLFFLLLPVMLFAGHLIEFLTVFFAALLHEISHIFSASLLGVKISSIKVLPIGLNASVDKEVLDNRLSKVIIHISGPLANILLFALGTIINSYYPFQPDGMRFFISVNAYLALFNMIPVLPLDGGEVIKEVLSGCVGLYSASIWMKRISIFISVLLFLMGIAIFIGNYNFSLILIGLYVVFSLKYEKTEAALMNIKNLIYRRSRILKKGIYPARDLVVIKSVRLCEIIKGMDFDRFHFVYVVDDDLKLIKVFTEQEIIDGMLKHNPEMTFEEFIGKNT